MTGIAWRLADFASRLLEPGERDAVLGDLAESRTTGTPAFWHVLGLVVRRQAALWMDWRPWVALIAVAGPAATMISLSSLRVWGTYDLYFWIGRNYADLDPAILQETHLTLANGILLMLRSSIVLACLAFTTGFLVGALSKRAPWISGGVFCAILLFGGVQFATVPRVLQALMVVLALLGMRFGLHPLKRPLGRSLLWAAAIVTAVVGQQSWLWWPVRSPWRLEMISLTRYWPLVYLIAAATWHRWGTAFVKQSYSR